MRRARRGSVARRWTRARGGSRMASIRPATRPHAARGNRARRPREMPSGGARADSVRARADRAFLAASRRSSAVLAAQDGDRKSTRLNSSHGSISYAVFCLKKKKRKKNKERKY